MATVESQKAIQTAETKQIPNQWLQIQEYIKSTVLGLTQDQPKIVSGWKIGYTAFHEIDVSFDNSKYVVDLPAEVLAVTLPQKRKTIVIAHPIPPRLNGAGREFIKFHPLPKETKRRNIWQEVRYEITKSRNQVLILVLQEPWFNDKPTTDVYSIELYDNNRDLRNPDEVLNKVRNYFQQLLVSI